MSIMNINLSTEFNSNNPNWDILRKQTKKKDFTITARNGTKIESNCVKRKEK